mgnify:CR=1 FL=1
MKREDAGNLGQSEEREGFGDGCQGACGKCG